MVDQIKSENQSMSEMAMDMFIRKELEVRKDQYTYNQPCSIVCFTWNINGQKPELTNIEDLLTCKYEPNG